MSVGPDPQWRRARREARKRELARRRGVLAAGCAAVAVLAIFAVIALAGGGSSGAHGHGPAAAAPAARGGHGQVDGGGGDAAAAGHHKSAGAAAGAGAGGAAGRGATAATGPRAGTARAAILMYHVINSPPAGAPFPGLYVTPAEFAEQMRALAAAGYDAVTQDQLWANWHEGMRLPAGKPIVLSFDNGYQSQYTQALPVLRDLGWVGVENIQLTGLPPSQGGLSSAQVRGLVRAGWELDTQGISHADLTTLDAAELHAQVAAARGTIQRRYGVPVNWFCYPSGQYDAMVLAAVKAAGYRGSTTVVPGWAQAGEDPYRLPRLRVLGGTSGAALISEIAAIGNDGPPPSSYVTN